MFGCCRCRVGFGSRRMTNEGVTSVDLGLGEIARVRRGRRFALPVRLGSLSLTLIRPRTTLNCLSVFTCYSR